MKSNQFGIQPDYEVAQFRGLVIHQMILLEDVVNEILLTYFGRNEIIRTDFYNLVLIREQFSLKTKHECISYLLKSRFQAFYKKYPDLIIDFESFIKIRNDYAHKSFDKASLESETKLFLREYKLRYKKTTRGKIKEESSNIAPDYVIQIMINIINTTLQLKELLVEVKTNPE